MKNDINNFKTFVSDIKIAYYLLHAHENNYEIENLAYNLLGINVPTEDVEDDKEENKTIQTSLFDTLQNDITQTQKKDLSEMQTSILLLFLRKAPMLWIEQPRQ